MLQLFLKEIQASRDRLISPLSLLAINEPLHMFV